MDPLNTPKREILYIPEGHWARMLSEVTRLAPEEACGLLAGQGNQVLTVMPIENILHSKVRYRMEPQAQLNAFNHIDERGWELLAIYHSHPNGPATPSATDIDKAYYPETIYVIWSRIHANWVCRGFRIRNQQIQEIRLHITPAE